MTIIFKNFTEYQYFNSELYELKEMLIEYKDKETVGRRIDLKTLFPEVDKFIERLQDCSRDNLTGIKPIEIKI